MRQISSVINDIQSLFTQGRFLVPQSEIRFLQNGTIQEIMGNRNNGYVTVTTSQGQRITLTVNKDTKLRDQYLQIINFDDLEVGMTVSAAYSSRMTKSNPPQAAVYAMIAVVEPKFMVSTGVVAYADTRAGQLITAFTNNNNSQTIYHISADTEIFSRRGQRIPLSQLRPGNIVRIEHANFQTASIPPQTTAYRIDVIN